MTRAKVKDGSLTGVDVDASTLGKVSSAADTDQLGGAVITFKEPGGAPTNERFGFVAY